jgi:hypothetical protein
MSSFVEKELSENLPHRQWSCIILSVIRGIRSSSPLNRYSKINFISKFGDV